MVARRPSGGGQTGRPSVRQRHRVQATVPARGRGGPDGRRVPHRTGGGGQHRRRPAVDGYRLRGRAAAQPGPGRMRGASAGQRAGARGRAGGSIGRDPLGRDHPPGPEAGQHTAGRGRPSRCRFRHSARHRRLGRHRPAGDAGIHGTRSPDETTLYRSLRHLRARRGTRVRRRNPPVRRGCARSRQLPGRARGA